MAALSGAALAVPLAGCTTTQTEAQRLQLDAARQRAALVSTRVSVASRTVTASRIGLVREGRDTAVVVTVRNTGGRPVSDLPISVGYERPAGARVYLNDTANLGYFEAHLPVVAAGRELTWVYTTHAALPAGARPFAVIGVKPAAPARITEPVLRIGLEYGHLTGSGSVSVHLDNQTGVPQYQLQVYAYARQGDRYVAAGNATVAELNGDSRRHLELRLVGAAASATLHVQAVPTILQ